MEPLALYAAVVATGSLSWQVYTWRYQGRAEIELSVARRPAVLPDGREIESIALVAINRHHEQGVRVNLSRSGSYASARVQIVRFVRDTGRIGQIGRTDLGQRWATTKLCQVSLSWCGDSECPTKVRTEPIKLPRSLARRRTADGAGGELEAVRRGGQRIHGSSYLTQSRDLSRFECRRVGEPVADGGHLGKRAPSMNKKTGCRMSRMAGRAGLLPDSGCWRLVRAST